MKNKLIKLFLNILKIPIYIIKLIFKPLSPLISKLNSKIKKKFYSNVRLELIGTFFLCLFLSIISFIICFNITKQQNKTAYINYEWELNRFNRNAEDIVKSVLQQKLSVKAEDDIMRLIGYHIDTTRVKVIISDLDGNILIKTQNVEEIKLDIFNIIKNISEKNSAYKNQYYNNSVPQEYTILYPLNFTDSKTYLILKYIPKGTIEYTYPENFPIFISIIQALALFLFLFFILTKRKMLYIEEISDGLIQISKGNLDFKVLKKGEDELSTLAENINVMSEALKNKIEAERRAESTKNELITNVSHDLRTPLTSIMGYLGLIKEKKYENEESLSEYVNIAFNKSEKLKKLIDDLFQYTKLTNKVESLTLTKVDLKGMFCQLLDEFVPIFEENNLTLEKDFLNEKVTLLLDSDKIIRVFENLLMNAVKYCIKPSTIKVKIYKEDINLIVCVQNKSELISKEDLTYIFDRFHKLDKSRASYISGSGLGLAIAKSIVEMHEGKIWAECLDDNISFFISFKLNNELKELQENS